jgi:predicted secreted protein
MKLQSSMQLGGVQFSISPAARAQREDELITEAIKAFQSRADAIRSAMGAKAYKTVHFSINHGMSPYRPMPLMREAKFSSAMSAPEFAGGDSRMTIQISGTIEMR